MGAMLRFRQQTGKEITQIDGGFSDMLTYLWCCTVSACKRDGVEFPYTLMDFADRLTPDDLTAWTEAMRADAPEAEADDGEKKN